MGGNLKTRNAKPDMEADIGNSNKIKRWKKKKKKEFRCENWLPNSVQYKPDSFRKLKKKKNLIKLIYMSPELNAGFLLAFLYINPIALSQFLAALSKTLTCFSFVL